MTNNIWQIEVSKPQSEETYYLMFPQASTMLIKSEINSVLNKFRNYEYKINLHGFGPKHYEKYKNTPNTIWCADFDFALLTLSQLKFHKQVVYTESECHDIFLDQVYLTQYEINQLESTKRWHTVYQEAQYTFLSIDLPRKIRLVLGINHMSRYDNWIWFGNLIWAIDYRTGIVRFYNRTRSNKEIVKLVEI